MNKQIVYIPTKVQDELPLDSNKNIADYYTTNEGIMWKRKASEIWYKPGMSIADPHNQPKCWMKPIEGYFFTEEELKQLLEKTFVAGENYNQDNNKAENERIYSANNTGVEARKNKYFSKEEYIKNFLNK